MTERHFQTPVFSLAGKTPSQRIVYAPLRRLAFAVNESGARAVEAIRQHAPDEAPAGFIARLDEMGLFEALKDEPVTARAEIEDEYRPVSATLFLTGKCNLHCSYCYARGGETDSAMPWETARAALDFIVDNAVAKGGHPVKVIFHGDGEPTLAWSVMEQSIAYTEKRCAREGIGCSFEAGMNGIVSESRLRWLAGKLSNITISVDGPPRIHDAQRPLAADGRPSSALVERTLRILDEAQAGYGVRCTITPLSVGEMPAIVDYICSVSGARMLMFEPAFSAGRALSSGMPALDPGDFVRGFLTARLVARGYGRRLVFSGARADQIVNRFCGAMTGAFNVTQDGRITSCYEVFSKTDSRISDFEIGGYRGPGRGFWVDRSRIEAAAKWTASEKAPCQSCFAKFHCAGDCAAKVSVDGDPATSVNPARCYVIREITRAQIFSLYGMGDVSEPSEEWRGAPPLSGGRLVQIRPAVTVG